MSTILRVEGMMCQHCVAHVKKALEGVPGAEDVTVSLEEGNAVVTGTADVAAMRAAVEEAGYQVTGVSQASVPESVTLRVEGMMCQHCVAHVKKALEGVPGAEDVTVSLEEGNAVVTGTADVAAMRAAVEEAGYQVTGVQ